MILLSQYVGCYRQLYSLSEGLLSTLFTNSIYHQIYLVCRLAAKALANHGVELEENLWKCSSVIQETNLP